MNVKELINILSELDPDTLVVVDGYEGGYTTPKKAITIKIKGPDNNVKYYYGEYEVDTKGVEAIYLPR